MAADVTSRNCNGISIDVLGYWSKLVAI